MSQETAVKDSLSKRLLIFAHYDKNKIVDDYVIYYLCAFRRIVDKIIFVSDCDLNEPEKNKLDEIADVVIAKPHGEYDFGSYKLGFLYALENSLLNDTGECIFANDSCFGPFYPLKPIFEQMEIKSGFEDLDFWGITENEFKRQEDVAENIKTPHVQSYFLVLNKKVFLSDVFIKFIQAIKKQESKLDIVENYEIGLSQTLLKSNFKMGSYIGNIYPNCFDITREKWADLIISHNMPFLKTYLLKTQYKNLLNIDKYPAVIEENACYPVKLIAKHILRFFLGPNFMEFIQYIKNHDVSPSAESVV